MTTIVIKQEPYTSTEQMAPAVTAGRPQPQAWKFGLFDCFGDCGLCTFFLSCIRLILLNFN